MYMYRQSLRHCLYAKTCKDSERVREREIMGWEGDKCTKLFKHVHTHEPSDPAGKSLLRSTHTCAAPLPQFPIAHNLRHIKIRLLILQLVRWRDACQRFWRYCSELHGATVNSLRNLWSRGDGPPRRSSIKHQKRLVKCFNFDGGIIAHVRYA